MRGGEGIQYLDGNVCWISETDEVADELSNASEDKQKADGSSDGISDLIRGEGYGRWDRGTGYSTCSRLSLVLVSTAEMMASA